MKKRTRGKVRVRFRPRDMHTSPVPQSMLNLVMKKILDEGKITAGVKQGDIRER
ncbi:hypothetical protein PISMIDRAFT_687064 [Pisolithus microcarpus 441]|uniref:Unplaced genomic scaffold scaffold_196, whole genome shotgun sequence n=1 Tax=Pisolithus microcarpus 441 TaxID=765257 RepID=A0A0C9YPF4_9AGAM|nr:hypothetical protein PISMIDRAFT_687064 [Pisolithus microcarpus 441]